ncbi:MAG TPA: hypothetical protein ENF95_00940 [Candidatus Aenigmarchaeota archaeon]|nr:hypothetical protein [Candidatus Aenigmarchaeota archaeon]
MNLTRIAEYIREKGIKPSDCVYHTWRDLEDESGEKKGEIRVLVLEDNVARVEYQCPKCGHVGYEEKPWKRPFSVKCEECGHLIRVPKLRDQIKKRS